MLDKPLDQISVADINAMIAHGRTEGRSLDFKLLFPGKSDRAVKDFLADVTALANTDGGDIIIGIREDGNGVAVEVVGITAETLDDDLLRIESQVRNCVDPRVPEFRVQSVSLANSRIIVVLRVGASMSAPHRVTYNNSSRFHARSSRGNYEMSTGQLRAAFAASDEMPRKLRDLHHRAVEATSGKDLPCRLAELPAVVLTVAPMSVLREARDISVSRETAVLPPQTSSGTQVVVGLDGLIAHSTVDNTSNAVRNWSITYRRGYVDVAWVIGRKTNDGRKIISPRLYEAGISDSTRSSIARLRSLGVEGPWVAMVTLISIRGYQAALDDYYCTSAAWQDPAYLGEIVDDTLGLDRLQPFTERFWRVFGIDPSIHAGH